MTTAQETEATDQRVLVLNAGSATLKATVLDVPDEAPRFERTVDWSAAASATERRAAIEAVLDGAADSGVTPRSLRVVAHRVVHGGERFTGPAVIDDPVVAALDALDDLAPLHNPLAVATIRAARERLPAIPHVALFDTAFHADLPEVARRYPVPDEWARDHGIRRFGFHGLSVEWSVARTGDLLGRDPAGLRLVVAHLGGGCSVTAVDGGRSVDTSMGLTPLEGLMMATRAGSIDPGIIFRLLRAGLGADEIERRLEHDSGLLGVGGTSDMRMLLAAAGGGDARATLAIDLFVHRAAAGMAAAATALPALDALVFTGGIGEHAAPVRARICERLRGLGVPAAGTVGDGVGEGAADALLAVAPAGASWRPAVVRVHAREDVVMARAAVATLTARRP